jgi:hypothetical protein
VADEAAERGLVDAGPRRAVGGHLEVERDLKDQSQRNIIVDSR